MLSDEVILVQNFWRLLPILSSSQSTPIQSPTTLRNISKQVFFHSAPLPRHAEGCLAYDRGKVAVLNRHGIYVLVLDSILDEFGEIDLPPKDISLQTLPRSPGHEPPWPNLRFREVKFCGVEMSCTGIILCVQLTETKLYFSVFPNDVTDERGENMWCYNFA